MPKHSRLQRLGSGLGAMLLCACVALFVGVTVLPRVFGIELRTVVSGSMEPAIGKGALVVASPVSASDLRVGDVIMFRAPDSSGRVITHRVAGLHDDGASRTIQTRGDANNENDPWTVAPGDLLGKVRGDIPYAGYVVEKVRSPLGFVLLMIVPALVVVGGEASVWRRFLRDRRIDADRARPPHDRWSAPVAATHVAAPPANPYLYPVLHGQPERPRRRPSPFILAVGVMTLAVVAVAAVMLVIAPRPASDDGEARVTAEAVSVAHHSGSLADGEAFDGDIQILRNASDVRLLDTGSPADRATALRQMLLLNTNRFDALALADLHGVAVASSGPAFGAVTESSAYLQAIATDGVATSAVAMLDDAATIDYAAPVRDASGATQTILIGRTTPERLWTATLGTSIDGGRNMVIDADGTIIAATDRALNGTPSGLTSISNAQRLDIGGTPSICALAPIGRGTHLDHGSSVASCLPAALAVTASPFPATQFLLNAIAVALVTFSAALLLLAWLLGERAPDSAKRAAPPSGLKAIEARLLAQRDGHGPR